MNIGSLIAVLFLFLIVPAYGRAETVTEPGDKERNTYYLYEWTDRQGIVHITDSFGKVPEAYRSQARKLESQKGPDTGVEQEWNRPSAPDEDLEANEDEAKFEWQQRFRDQKRRLERAERRYQNLQQERDGLFAGSSALTSIENRVKYEQLEQQMKEVQAEIDDARKMIDTVIPEEARKAGVPPGWLRE